MRFRKKSVFPYLFVLSFFTSYSQVPEGYFRNPLNLPMSLAGNFGELRPNHYHMGLDLRTNGKVNQPVFAAADGYVSRIKVEPQGFGQAIYINHPNGYTTVYAHLNQFFPELERYVKQQQYQRETWEIFIELEPGQFPVKKGQFIAYSGSTGGSQAPHVHYEIRTTKDDVNRNPQLFHLELQDNTDPLLYKLAIYDRNKSTYEQMPRILALKKQAGIYKPLANLVELNSNLFSFAIQATDTHSGSSHTVGIYEAILFLDEVEQERFTMDRISYDNTRFVNAHVDYKTKANGGPWLQHLSQLPGYPDGIYKPVAGSGVIRLNDEGIHNIRIDVKDANNNTSSLRFQVRAKPGMVDTYLGNAKTFYPLMIDVGESPECEFFIGEKCLYDSVHIGITSTTTVNPQVVSGLHAIGQAYIPLQDSFTVRIKPTKPMADSNRIVMQRFAGSKKNIQKVVWQNGWAAAKFREFGNFQLVLDDEPPEIVPLGHYDHANLSHAYQISFTVRDNLESFQNFRAELDGKWLRFTNDKGKVFTYRFDEHCLPGPHQLKIHVEDEAGNVAEEIYEFSR